MIHFQKQYVVEVKSQILISMTHQLKQNDIIWLPLKFFEYIEITLNILCFALFSTILKQLKF